MNNNSTEKADINQNDTHLTVAKTMNPADKKAFANEFYNRQTIMKELGQKGQRKLNNAKVAIVGAGGLGTVSALYLALAGIGCLRLIDQDTVEIPNLHRQILYTTDDLKYPKVEAAAKRLKKVNPLVKVEPISENLNATNVEKLLANVDCVVDGLDNMLTRYMVNRACVKLKVPYVFGAAIGMEGNLSVFSTPETPCLECVMPNLSDVELLTCNTRGVLGATPGIIGAMQAMEAIKTLAGIGSTLKNKLMVCDFTDMSFATIDISKRQNCPACQGESGVAKLGERLVWLCGQNTANINPEKPLQLSFNQLHERIKQKFKIRVKSHLAIIFNYKEFEVSLFNGGRMLIKNVTSEKTALKTYKEIMSQLNTET
jgi:adenylyltransferase/sulfurtransferase